VRHEQTNFGVPSSRTVLIGFSQGGTVGARGGEGTGHRRRRGGVLRALCPPARARHADPVAHSPRARRVRLRGVARVRGARGKVLAGLHVPVTLDIVEDLGHALSHRAISLGSLRLLQGTYEGRRATLH